MKVMICSNWS